ncbi:hypothetical protein COO60DRAFT_38728 [Scenedesmus sp. NREL 46B-D3]|nr:hypothetical protein COO60DRAFT_38728 [Scenedesmus sp. NREL 46B-D3]
MLLVGQSAAHMLVDVESLVLLGYRIVICMCFLQLTMILQLFTICMYHLDVAGDMGTHSIHSNDAMKPTILFSGLLSFSLHPFVACTHVGRLAS